MEAATIPDEQTVNGKPDAAKSVSELFRYSGWVHVGPGADECEHREDGACKEHFHAWVRLPNQFQHEDIQKRARAARARLMRRLRDPESDAYQVLEADMDELARSDERSRIIDTILSFNDSESRLIAMRDVEASEDFANHLQDVERWRELRSGSELGEQEADELAELDRYLERYQKRVEEEIEQIQAPKRASLERLTSEELVAQIRDRRIEAEGMAEFQRVYAMYEMWICTLRSSARPHQRIFASLEEMAGEAPEVIIALREFINELETDLARGATGN